MDIKDILTIDEYNSLTQFSEDEINWLNGRIKVRKDGKPGVECIIRGKNRNDDFFELKPEEIIRQLYTYKLIHTYGYSNNQIKFETPAVYAGKELVKDKRIDIAIFSKKNKKKIDIIIEVKRPSVKDENFSHDGESTTPLQQLESYCLLKKAQIGVIGNGANLLKFYSSPDFDCELTIDRFPKASEDISDWLENRRFTLKQLIQSDRLQKETLKDVIKKVEQRFGANDASDKAFDEIFKLVFIKLYDEKASSDDADDIANQIKYLDKKLAEVDDKDFRVLEFRTNENETPDETYDKISKLFEEAKSKWPGVFSVNEKLNMQKATVKSCVRELQNVKMFNSNLEVVDDAFEYLVNKNQKGEMGQYFTPRYVIDLCVMMLNPKPQEKMIDPAAGSCGFPMHTIFHVWKRLNPQAPNLFTTNKRTQREIDYVQNNVFGIDFSEKSVRVGRMLNIIAGDGQTNVIELNSLDYYKWKKDYLDDPYWFGKYASGFQKLSTLERKDADGERFKFFDFDILMANPPFAGDLDNKDQLAPYKLSQNSKGKLQKRVGRDVLFIERNLNLLKPGGRMAIVLPQGRFNNYGDQLIREYILDQCRLIAVVGLHVNAFKPHTSTKTSVLLVQKWTDDSGKYPNICPKPNRDAKGKMDYPIFFATMKEPSKDNSGEKIYVTENYVKVKRYSYKSVEIIMRDSDRTVISRDEYEKITNKNNYVRSDDPVGFIDKKSGVIVDKSSYLSDKRSYKPIYSYTRRYDGKLFTQSEFQEITKKSNYTISIQSFTNVEEIKDDSGNSNLIRDLFVEKYGPVENYNKWIRKNVEFTLKKTKQADNRPRIVSFDAYMALDFNEKKFYKEIPVLGPNNNEPIGKDEYCLLSDEERKYYLVSEETVEWSERITDTHGHIFVKHDLFNQDPNLPNLNPKNIYAQNGIAEAFAKFAYDEKLSFAPSKDELDQILHPYNELPFV